MYTLLETDYKIIKGKENFDYDVTKDLFTEYKEELEYLYARYILCSSMLRMIMIKDKNIREKMIQYAWNSLNNKFPQWKNNKYLKDKNLKHSYMLSVTPNTLKIYTKLGRVKFIRKKIQEKFA